MHMGFWKLVGHIRVYLKNYNDPTGFDSYQLQKSSLNRMVHLQASPTWGREKSTLYVNIII